MVKGSVLMIICMAIEVTGGVLDRPVTTDKGGKTTRSHVAGCIVNRAERTWYCFEQE